MFLKKNNFYLSLSILTYLEYSAVDYESMFVQKQLSIVFGKYAINLQENTNAKL